MTSHAIATTVRPHAVPEDVLVPALRAPVRTRSDVDRYGPADLRAGLDAGEDYWMYLQLRATTGTVNACLTRLDRHLAAHPAAEAEIVGIGTDARTVRVIIGVNLGDSYRIKARPENVLAAYDFVQSLSTDMANFWPQYLLGVPTDDERDLLASVVAAGTITTRPAPARPVVQVEVDLFTFEPEREYVLDGTGGLWQVETQAA